MAPGDFGKKYSKLNDKDVHEEDMYKKTLNSVVYDIQLMSNNVNTVKTLINQLKSHKDKTRLLEQIEKKQTETNQLAHNIGNELKYLSTMEAPNIEERSLRNNRVMKIKTNFSEVLKNFQICQRSVVDIEKESINFAVEQGNQETLIEGITQHQAQMEEQLEEEVPIEEIERREKAIKKLEQDVIGVNEIFRDLATMVHEQGYMIDSIEANVEVTGQRVEAAATELNIANKYQKQSRKKILILIAILVGVIVAIGLIIYFSTKN